MISPLKKFFHFYRAELEGLCFTMRRCRNVSRFYSSKQTPTPPALEALRDIVRNYDLNITKRVNGIDSDIDVLRNAAPRLFSELSAYSRQQGTSVHLRTSDGNWRDVSGARLAKWLRCIAPNQPTEVAVIGVNSELLERFSLNIWRRAAGALMSNVSDAPAKKMVPGTINVKTWENLPTDRQIEAIDVVYTWVNADDPAWRAALTQYSPLDNIDRDRFQQVDELKYSLRSLFTYAPWVRTVYIFSNCAPPQWFKSTEKIQWVWHQDVIPAERLPLFNSHAIETYLHEIPALSERYIYFNDDVFLAAPVRPTDFFTVYGQSVSRMEPYGMTGYLANLAKDDKAQDWQHAAVNASRLLYQQNNVFPTGLHHHAPFAIVKSVYRDMVERYAKQVDETRRAMFRLKTDCSFTSFMYHHYALSQGKAQHTNEGSYIVKASNFLQFYLSQKGRKMRFFCINDGGGSATNRRFMAFKIWYLEKRFPFKSPAEK